MILLIDNYDSFTYNVVQRLGELGPELDVRVYRNDQITPEQVARLGPSHLIISPGPCTPREAGVCNEVLRRFPDRIYHVHIKDVVLTLTGRSSLLGSYLPYGDPRRGWQPRAPGRGGLDWEAIIRALNEAGYDGPLAVEWRDPGMDRAYGAEEARKFVQRLDFDPPPRAEDRAFR